MLSHNQQEFLKTALSKLRSGEISTITYGDMNTRHPGAALFRIEYIDTVCGRQFCIRNLHNGIAGSGQYLGRNPDDWTLILCINERYEYANRPVQNPKFKKMLEQRNITRNYQFDFYETR